MPINETSPEIVNCTCFDNEEFKMIKKIHDDSEWEIRFNLQQKNMRLYGLHLCDSDGNDRTLDYLTDADFADQIDEARGVLKK